MRIDSNTSDAGLPEPTAAEAELNQRLVKLIRNDMAGKPIGFARFMEMALFAPGLGYYSAGKHKMGEAGDFVTAPELGNVFATCVARQCKQVLKAIGGGDILEVGAGSGALAADLLAELERLRQLPNSYYILELSADLRERQRQHIEQMVPHLHDRVHWLDDFPQPNMEGVILANELLDAMPVSLFCTTEEGVKERFVAADDNGFRWSEQAASTKLTERVTDLDLPIGYCSEINFNAEGWIRSAADVLHRGVVLLFDYGFPQHEYYHPQRIGGTLMCHYRHRAHTDPLILVGLQDITAHVDFTAMARAAVHSGFDVLGYTAQAPFLMASGLNEFMAQSDPNDAKTHLQITNQVKKLTLPSEMGELFKVLALGKDFDESLIGFQLQDRRDRL